MSTPSRAGRSAIVSDAPPMNGQLSMIAAVGWLQQLTVQYECLVEPAASATAEDDRRDLHRVELRRAERRGAIGDEDPRHRDAIGHGTTDLPAEPGRDVGGRRGREAALGRDAAEVALDQRDRVGGVDIADDRQHRVVRRVPGRVEGPRVLERRRRRDPPSSRSSCGGTGGRAGSRARAGARATSRTAGCRGSGASRS